MNAILPDKVVKMTDTTERRPHFKVICTSESEEKPEDLQKMIHSFYFLMEISHLVNSIYFLKIANT